MPFSTLEELKAALKDHTSLDDVVDFVVSQTEKEKQTGIDLRRKANKEAENLRKQIKQIQGQLSDLGYEDDSDLAEFIDSLKEKTNQSQANDSELAKTVKKLTKQLNTVQQELAEKTQAEAELRTKALKGRIKETLGKSLNDKVYGAQYVIDALINNGQVVLDEDSDAVVWANGDTRTPYEAGLKTWIEQNQDLMRNTQKSGSGSPTASNEPRRSISFDQMKTMSKDDIRSNLGAIKESLGLKTSGT